MKTMAPRLRWIALLACAAGPAVFAASKPDLIPTEKRAAAISTGQRLARPGERTSVAADIASPFSPADFNVPDEPPATKPVATNATTGAGASVGAGAASTGPRLGSAREIVEAMALRIPAKGTIQQGGEYLLSVTGVTRPFKIGDTFTIGVDDSPKYTLEITSIKATEFTVRYKGESKTRPIIIKSTSQK